MTDTLREAAGRSLVGSDRPTIRQLVEKQRDQIGRALGNPEVADQFVRAVLTELGRTPKLQECTPQSLLGAVMTCAHLGLEPGPMQLVALLPFWNNRTRATEVQLIIQYRGYIELAMRSGLLAHIEAREVCKNDYFHFKYGLHPRLEHDFDLETDRGPIIGFYGIAFFGDGKEPYFLVLPRTKVDEYRARAKASEKGPWVTDYDAMGRKTVIRRMEPFLPKSTKMAQAFAVDGRTVLQVSRDENVVQEPPEEEDSSIEDAVVVPTPPQDAPEPTQAPSGYVPTGNTGRTVLTAADVAAMAAEEESETAADPEPQPPQQGTFDG